MILKNKLPLILIIAALPSQASLSPNSKKALKVTLKNTINLYLKKIDHFNIVRNPTHASNEEQMTFEKHLNELLDLQEKIDDPSNRSQGDKKTFDRIQELSNLIQNPDHNIVEQPTEKVKSTLALFEKQIKEASKYISLKPHTPIPKIIENEKNFFGTNAGNSCYFTALISLLSLQSEFKKKITELISAWQKSRIPHKYLVINFLKRWRSVYSRKATKSQWDNLIADYYALIDSDEFKSSGLEPGRQSDPSELLLFLQNLGNYSYQKETINVLNWYQGPILQKGSNGVNEPLEPLKIDTTASHTVQNLMNNLKVDVRLPDGSMTQKPQQFNFSSTPENSFIPVLSRGQSHTSTLSVNRTPVQIPDKLIVRDLHKSIKYTYKLKGVILHKGSSTKYGHYTMVEFLGNDFCLYRSDSRVEHLSCSQLKNEIETSVIISIFDLI